MWDASKCDLCGDCLVKCRYVDYDKDRAIREIKLLMEGKAADIKVTGRPPKAIAVIADNIGFKGIGVYTHNGNSFVHLDVRPTKRIWRDQPGKTLVAVKSVKDIPD